MPKITKTTTPATPESAPERSDETTESVKTTETATPTVEETTVPATAKKTTNKIVPGSKKNTAPVATPATPEKKGKAKSGPGAAATPKTAPAPKAGEFRWTEKRVAIVKALRALKANGELNARTSLEIQAQAGEEISLNDVKHYLYKDNDLVTEGYTACIKGLEGLKGIGYYLTEKGRKADLKLPE